MGLSISDTAAIPTLDEALRRATRRLAEAGISNAGTDARIFLCAAAGIERATLLRDGGSLLTENATKTFDAFIARRLRREPVSRILGRREFWGLDLLVTPDVLDPRPDTETLVEAALARMASGRLRPWRILDLGTGSGAILCALLNEAPAALGWGIDRSLGACRVAKGNLRLCGIGERGLIVHGDWGASLAAETFDIVVSNPPYIETATIEHLDAEVRDHDPAAALDGGADGLDAYRAIATQLPALLRPGGAAFLEVGFGQAEAVSHLLHEAGLKPGGTFRDLAGIERVVSAAKAS